MENSPLFQASSYGCRTYCFGSRFWAYAESQRSVPGRWRQQHVGLRRHRRKDCRTGDRRTRSRRLILICWIF